MKEGEKKVRMEHHYTALPKDWSSRHQSSAVTARGLVGPSLALHPSLDTLSHY